MKNRLIVLFLLAAVAVWAGTVEIPLTGIYNSRVGTNRARGEVVGFCNPVTERKGLSCYADFNGCPDNANSYVRFEFQRKFAGNPEKILWNIEAKEDTKGMILTAWLVDRNGEVYLSRKQIDWQGNKKVVFDIPVSPAWPSGDSNNRIDLPLTIIGMAMERTGEKQRGTVLLQDWSVVTDLSQGTPFVMSADIPSYVWGGNKVEFPISLANYAHRKVKGVTATVKVFDRYHLRQVLERKTEFKDKDANTAVAPLSLELPFGSYEVITELYDNGKLIDSNRNNLQHFKGDCSKASPEVVDYEMKWSPMGGVWGFMSAEEGSRFGAFWERFEGPNWGDVEIKRDVYDTAEMEKKAKEEVDNHVRPVVLQTLYLYPKFRDPKDLPDFSRGYGMAMKNISAALKPYTRYFELGNEDNGHSKFMYTEVARNAAAGVRSQQPFAVISNSGTAFIDNSWMAFQYNRGLSNYFDAFCVHPYTNNSTPSQSVSAEKLVVGEKLESMNALVDRFGGMKELWSTEFGWPNSDKPEGEKDRADLYLRESVVCDSANLTIGGLYTFKRDYGIVDFPAGASINAYNNFRAGHRFAGLIVDGDIWTAVYEKSGKAFAVVWTPEAKTETLKITGQGYYDLFGNILEAGKVKVSQSPVFVTGIDGQLLRQAVESNVTKKKQFFLNCLKENPSAVAVWKSLEKCKPMDTATLDKTLVAWAKTAGKIDAAKKAAAGRVVDWYLEASRLETAAVVPSGFNAADQNNKLHQHVENINRNDLDQPGLRYLLNRWEKVTAEKQLAEKSGAKKYAAACARQEYVLGLVAAKFARDEIPFQFAVFSMLYMSKNKELQERLLFVPGEFTLAKVRVSSYSTTEQKVKLRPVLPAGWVAEPASVEVVVKPSSFALTDFKIKAPTSDKNQKLEIKVVASIDGKPDNVMTFDDIEIVPAVKVNILPVGDNLNRAPLKVEVLNQEGKKISGTIRLLQSGTAGKSLGQFTFNDLPPFKKSVFDVALTEIPVSLHPGWKVDAEVILNDGRRFIIPGKIDFTVAVKAPGKMNIDARLDEWAKALPLKLDREEYSFGSFGGAWSPEDCSAVSYLMWDDENLYFGAEVQDQTFNQQYDRDSMWKQDSIQIIFAPDRNETKPRELTLALSPQGPKVWDGATSSYLESGKVAIKYENRKCFYEAAIPWNSFDAKFVKAVKSGRFLYAIAVNDDDAITSRRFMERFFGSIIHGKDVNTFAETMLAGSDDRLKTVEADPNEIMKEDFNNEKPGKAPIAWNYICNNMSDNALTIVKNKGRNNTACLRLENKDGSKPNHYAIVTLPLTGLKSNRKYELEFWVKGMINPPDASIGMCTDLWGNIDYCYSKWTPSGDWQKVVMPFSAPVSGNYRVIVRCADATNELLVDDISVRMR